MLGAHGFDLRLMNRKDCVGASRLIRWGIGRE